MVPFRRKEIKTEFGSFRVRSVGPTHGALGPKALGLGVGGFPAVRTPGCLGSHLLSAVALGAGGSWDLQTAHLVALKQEASSSVRPARVPAGAGRTVARTLARPRPAGQRAASVQGWVKDEAQETPTRVRGRVYTSSNQDLETEAGLSTA